MPTWRHEICERDGSNEAVITRTGDRSAGLPLSGIPTAGGLIHLDHPLAARIRGLGGQLLKTYRDGVLATCGPLITSDASWDGKTGRIAYGSAGAWWRMGHRLLGQAVNADKRGVGYTEGTPLATVDKSTIAQHLVDNENSKGDTGIRIGVITASGAGFLGPWYFKLVTEAYVELGGTLDGFEFEVVPTEPTADGLGIKIGTLNVKPTIGTDKSTGANAIIFEAAGGKRNVATWSEQGTLEGLANRPVSLPAGFPDAHDLGSGPTYHSGAINTAASEAAHGIHEAMVSDDLSVDSYRQQLVDEHARIRQVARKQITFQPTKTGKRSYPLGVPAPAGGYSYGDIVGLKAYYRGATVFDVATRIYNIAIAVSPTGVETVTLTTIPS